MQIFSPSRLPQGHQLLISKGIREKLPFMKLSIRFFNKLVIVVTKSFKGILLTTFIISFYENKYLSSFNYYCRSINEYLQKANCFRILHLLKSTYCIISLLQPSFVTFHSHEKYDRHRTSHECDLSKPQENRNKKLRNGIELFVSVQFWFSLLSVIYVLRM